MYIVSRKINCAWAVYFSLDGAMKFWVTVDFVYYASDADISSLFQHFF